MIEAVDKLLVFPFQGVNRPRESVGRCDNDLGITELPANHMISTDRPLGFIGESTTADTTCYADKNNTIHDDNSVFRNTGSCLVDITGLI